ncbi:MAG TPA: cupin domain-containing protein [Thermoanaerobaculia bacterium]|nr:cupin domain-containing protein [Thermoanaerobaculia bacterium]
MIEELNLEPHPEGGFYRQIYKSPMTVTEGERTRAALTVIHFLLPAGQISRWHRVMSDEVWTFLRGEPLRLHRFDGSDARDVVLDADHPIQVVRAGEWQAAEPLGAYALVACFVAPGFEFDDFALMDGETAAKLPEELRRYL